jgi:hypothetical protein
MKRKLMELALPALFVMRSWGQDQPQTAPAPNTMPVKIVSGILLLIVIAIIILRRRGKGKKTEDEF